MVTTLRKEPYLDMSYIISILDKDLELTHDQIQTLKRRALKEHGLAAAKYKVSTREVLVRKKFAPVYTTIGDYVSDLYPGQYKSQLQLRDELGGIFVLTAFEAAPRKQGISHANADSHCITGLLHTLATIPTKDIPQVDVWVKDSTIALDTLFKENPDIVTPPLLFVYTG